METVLVYCYSPVDIFCFNFLRPNKLVSQGKEFPSASAHVHFNGIFYAQSLAHEKICVCRPVSGPREDLYILVETSSPQYIKLLLKSKAIGDIPFEVTPCATLNSSRGVIVERDLKNILESEIFAGLSSQGVTMVHQIFTRKDGIKDSTNVLMLMFTSPRLPTAVKAGYLNCKVRPYIPNPLRCFQCQRFGHPKTSYRGSLVCTPCGGNIHDDYKSNLELHCVNCRGSHPSYSLSCLKLVEEKEVKHLKTINDIIYSVLDICYCTPFHYHSGNADTSFRASTELFAKHLKNLLPSINKKVDASMSTPISVHTTPSSDCPLSPPSGSNVSSGPSFSAAPKSKLTIHARPQSLESLSIDRTYLPDPGLDTRSFRLQVQLD
ncbi:uncharacterized protein LOC143254447 [Tachypleus tridentatus]|uniref:uncharacterized protein LOC143254447 n=1 Tax=Tachypleus tridentatus TaxID=6853 RepID=UPI003FD3E89A